MQLSVPLYSLTSRCPLLSVLGNLEFSTRIPIPLQRRPDDILYVAQPGDNLMKLAFKFYGDIRLWWVLYDANADQILGHPLDSLTGKQVPGPNMLSTATTEISVPGASMPWSQDGGLNAGFAINNNGTPPISVPVSPGDVLHITATGIVQYFNIFVLQEPPAGGAPTGDAESGGTFYPTHYMPGTSLGVAGLCGCFANDVGTVIKTLPIGADSTWVVPAGATQLLMGINDDFFADNSLQFDVTIAIDSVTPTFRYTPALTLRIPSRQAVEAELLDGPNV